MIQLLAVYSHQLTADSILVLSSVTEWWWGQCDGQQDEAHAGVHPKPSVQRLQSLQRAVWGELINQSLNIYISKRVCGAHCFLNQWRSNPSGHSDRKQPCVTHKRLCCFSEKLNQFIKSSQQIHKFQYQNTAEQFIILQDFKTLGNDHGSKYFIFHHNSCEVNSRNMASVLQSCPVRPHCCTSKYCSWVESYSLEQRAIHDVTAVDVCYSFKLQHDCNFKYVFHKGSERREKVYEFQHNKSY